MKKIHYHNPRNDDFGYLNAVSCNRTQRPIYNSTTDPRKVDCQRCLYIMMQPYQMNEDLRKFWITNLALSMK